MISGRDALSSLQTALNGVRGDEDRLVAALNAATEEAARLRASQADSLRGLARVRLDALTRDQTTRGLDAAERAALEILERRKTALQRAAESRRAFTLALSRGQDERRAAQEAVEQAAARIDDLREDVQADLESDEPWLVQRRKLTHAKDVARAADEKAARTEAEKAEKAAPYEADALFTYLWRRGFGTPAYRASPIVRFFDGRVARLIGYEEARANYHMLTEIPVRLRAHADRLAEEIAAEAAALAAIERAALEARGIEALEKALGDAEAGLAAVETSIADAEAGLARLDADERAAATGGGDPMLREALDLLSSALAADDLRTLQQEAAATPTLEDDAFVVRLRELEGAIRRADEKVEEARRAAVTVGARRKELERSAADFREKGYDDPFGGFVNERVIMQVLAGIVGGALSGRDLEKVLRDGFQRRPPKAPGGFGGGIRTPGGSPWGRGQKMGGSWGGSSGGFGGGSRGGFRTGGSFGGGGGGGFRTGGKF